MAQRGQDRRVEETEEQRNSRLSDMAQRGQERRAEETESQSDPERKELLLGIDMKLAKREEMTLLRVRDHENRQAKVHCSLEIADNCVDSSGELSGVKDIPLQPSLHERLPRCLSRKTKMRI
ncbi:hypothetical protein AVEN_274585-1 [Araneus ventricosus]|uniref:Uncharacterized protein n=1 Tax=Araneus ventricosus TaxID=182803 RepID=A0A4Y2L018_ARAVE|nr:hypothetical protein AVEN_274585-1 [Araneus ventricosus]